MSLTKQLLSEISRVNAQKSTGPRTDRGKQRSRLNAVKHNLSGQHLVLQESEVAAYNRMSSAMLNDLNPKSEPERQIAQKIIDINFRLNRLTAIENNLFTFGMTGNETDNDNDDRIEIMGAQTRAWTERANTFDLIGRYEARLSRQLLQYQKEFERLQTVRKEQIKEEKFDPASFGPPPDAYRILSYLPPPKAPQILPKPTPATQTLSNLSEACGTGDLVAGVLPQTDENDMAA